MYGIKWSGDMLLDVFCLFSHFFWPRVTEHFARLLFGSHAATTGLPNNLSGASVSGTDGNTPVELQTGNIQCLVCRGVVSQKGGFFSETEKSIKINKNHVKSVS